MVETAIVCTRITYLCNRLPLRFLILVIIHTVYCNYTDHVLYL